MKSRARAKGNTETLTKATPEVRDESRSSVRNYTIRGAVEPVNVVNKTLD